MAVYTEVPDDELASFVASYDIGTVTSCKGIAEGVENTNYMLTTTAGSYILTLYEKRVARADLPFFLGLMEHLAANGITCPVPLRNRAGLMLSELAGRPAALVTFLDGVWIRRPLERHCRALGEALAKLHRAGADFALSRTNALSLPGWHILGGKLGKDANKVAPGLTRLIGDELSHLEGHWPQGLPAGVIHADLFPNNVFFLGERLSGLIDFYFACNDFLAYDLAVCLNAWCFDATGRLEPMKSRALLESYHAARPLTAEEVSALPVLARGAALRFLLTRAYDWLHTADTALVSRLDPNEYITKLRFHQEVRSAAQYGLGAAA